MADKKISVEQAMNLRRQIEREEINQEIHG